ncbi:uncharacterized protein LOC113229682 [Hyposmocoma kahamanoa]|uniref:uncharacterized protein LOC113229682 n=1 Tax=Hyposmocoma kahamanoa TaxID=1477025 RepID=UPI000E6D64C3|nr:uncharacterized protein LOC113229682 [Hyposmocoma kahamanoa]
MSKDDIACLIDVIQSRPIIISKETNASTNKHKEEAWDSVTVAFNARCGSVPRTKQQLKLKWDNLKKAARKRAQQIRLNHLKTGGGKPDFILPDETLEKVSGLLGSTCSGFEVPFGGDGVGVVLNADTMMGDGNDSLAIEEVFYIDEGTPNVPKEDKNLVETPSKGSV